MTGISTKPSCEPACEVVDSTGKCIFCKEQRVQLADIAADWRLATHDALRTAQKAMFIINMNLHKPATQARKAAVGKAVFDLQVAADMMGVDYP